VIVNQVRALTRPAPPLDERYAPKVETAKRLSELKVEQDDLRACMDSRFAAQAKTASAGREKIYNALSCTREAVSALTREAELTRAQLRNLEAKLDKALDR